MDTTLLQGTPTSVGVQKVPTPTPGGNRPAVTSEVRGSFGEGGETRIRQ